MLRLRWRGMSCPQRPGYPRSRTKLRTPPVPSRFACWPFPRASPQKLDHRKPGVSIGGCAALKQRQRNRVASVGQHGADISLGNDGAIDLGVPMEPPHRLPPRDAAHVILDGVAGQDGLAKLALVDGQEI